MAENKLEIAICCMNDNWNNNMTCEASQVVKSVTDSIKTAKEIGCNSLIAMSGFVQTKVDTQKNIIIENLNNNINTITLYQCPNVFLLKHGYPERGKVWIWRDLLLNRSRR